MSLIDSIELNHHQEKINQLQVELEHQAQALEQQVLEGHKIQSLLQGKNKILQLISTGTSLPLILREVTSLSDRLSTAWQSSILLLNRPLNCLQSVADSPLPVAYLKHLERPIRESSVEACATAVQLQRTIFISDFSAAEVDPSEQALADEYGLAACCAIPVFV